jgi:hypothetical protein
MARKCRVCGCFDTRACSVLGVPCCWINVDLCSACATLGQLLASEDAGVPWLAEVCGEYFARELLAQTEPVEVPIVWRHEA